jgi:hypothetical protein
VERRRNRFDSVDVGRPNAGLVEDDLEGAIRELKAERDGETGRAKLLARTWRKASPNLA